MIDLRLCQCNSMPHAKIKVSEDQAILGPNLPLAYQTQLSKDTISGCQLSPSRPLMSSINVEMTRAKSLHAPGTQDNEPESKDWLY